ncbi:MAG: type 1 glutamine amidotransferase domain-containing protein [Candidatus Altiarchaeota archaeon]
MKALILAADGFEDSELFSPYHRLREEGIEVHIASSKKEKITGKHGYTYEVDKTFKEVDHQEYSTLIIIGGKAPEKMRLDPDALRIVQAFDRGNKTIAAICHGPQVLISADVLKGKRATSYKGILDDVKMAGAEVSDEEVVVDGNLITSRHYNDLSAFNREIIKKIKENK